MSRLVASLALVALLAAPAGAAELEAELERLAAVPSPVRPAFEGALLLREAARSLYHAPLLEITGTLEHLRELEFAEPVAWELKDREGVGDFVRHVFERDYPQERSDFDLAVLELMGFVEPRYPLRHELTELMTEQIQGAYDPKTRVFFVVPRPPSLLNRLLSAGGPSEHDLFTLHELDHALQDQRFDLLELMTWADEEAAGDQQMAVQALVEGDATLVMMDLAMRHQGQTMDDYPMPMAAMADMMMGLPWLPGMGDFSRAPLYFKRTLIFPYYTGCDFVLAVRRRAGWAGVDRMYADLPRSTEQVLHPYKYLHVRDDPVEVSFPALPAELGGWKRQGEDDVAGELVIRIFLEQHGAEDPVGGADGWGGDGFRVYRKGDRTFLVWLTAWDDASEREEFLAAARVAAAANPRPTEVVALEGGVGLLVEVPTDLRQRVVEGLRKASIQRPPAREPALLERGEAR